LCYDAQIHFLVDVKLMVVEHLSHFILSVVIVLQLRKKIKDIEIQWPLGAMFDVYGLFRRRTPS